MQLNLVRHCACLLAALLLWPLSGPGAGNGAAPSTAPATLATAMADYHRKLEAYTAARRNYEGEADAYWNVVARSANSQRQASQP